MRISILRNIVTATLASLLITTACYAENQSQTLLLATTQLINDSGLLAHLLPAFEQKTHIATHILTEQPFHTAQECKADALLADDQKAELNFMNKGWGDSRQEIMTYDFMLVGYKKNLADIDAKDTMNAVMKKIMDTKSKFISRSDNSETNKTEIRLWQAADISSRPLTKKWYYAANADMNTVLSIANRYNAYALTDRASWLNFQNRGNLAVIYEGNPALINQYSLITVNTAKCPNVNHETATTFSNWLSSADGQKMIGDFKINNEIAFKPIASAQVK